MTNEQLLNSVAWPQIIATVADNLAVPLKNVRQFKPGYCEDPNVYLDMLSSTAAQFIAEHLDAFQQYCLETDCLGCDNTGCNDCARPIREAWETQTVDDDTEWREMQRERPR